MVVCDAAAELRDVVVADELRCEVAVLRVVVVVRDTPDCSTAMLRWRAFVTRVAV